MEFIHGQMKMDMNENEKMTKLTEESAVEIEF